MGGRGVGRGAAEASAPASTGSAVATVLRAIDTAVSTTHAIGPPGAIQLADFREAMTRQGVAGRTEQDAAVKAALFAHEIDVSTAMDKRHMTDREIHAGIMIGGTVSHWIERQ